MAKHSFEKEYFTLLIFRRQKGILEQLDKQVETAEDRRKKAESEAEKLELTKQELEVSKDKARSRSQANLSVRCAGTEGAQELHVLGHGGGRVPDVQVS